MGLIMTDLSTAQLTLILLIKQNRGNKKLIAAIAGISDLLTNQNQTIITQGNEIMKIKEIVQVAEARIIAQNASLTKLKADADAAAATAASQAKSLQGQIDILTKQVQDLQAQQVLDSASATELTKLADLLKVDPETGFPLTPGTP